MPPPFRLPSQHIVKYLEYVREMINSKISVFFVNFSGLEYADFHVPELQSVFEKMGAQVSVLEPYIAPLCFFTADMSDLRLICDYCSYVTTVKLFGRVCAVAQVPEACDATKYIVEESFPLPQHDVRFYLYANYIGETGVSTSDKIAVLSSIYQYAGFYAPAADLSYPNFIFSMAYDFISEPTRFVLAAALPVAATKRDLLKHYQLSKRPYIGPTSMDSELASIMVGIAYVKPGDMVYDCFCGTASILVAAGAEGANCFGSDFDFAVLRGKKMKASVLNFRLYNYTLPDFVNCNCFQLPYCYPVFDALICDPPYSIRACCAAEEVEKLYLQLLAVAAVVLRPGGRLVFWMPVLNTFDRQYPIFKFAGGCAFKQKYTMFYGLNSKYGRILLCFEKIGTEYQCECSFAGVSGLNELRQQLGLGRRKSDAM